MYQDEYPAYESAASGSAPPRPFGEIPGLWLKVFQMSEEFFAAEAPRASGGNTFLNVLIYAFISMILTAISTLVSNVVTPMLSPELQPYASTGMGASLGASLCVGFLLPIISFYLSAGIYWVVAKIFGGEGDFGTQAYLTSLFTVPLGTIIGILVIIPCVGIFLGLIVGIYVLVLQVRMLSVVHDLTTGKAVGIVLVIFLVGIVFFACFVFGLLMLLGPIIEEIFREIEQGLQYVGYSINLF